MDFCHVADHGCTAPAGWGNGNGYAEGTRKTAGLCSNCGESTCGECSKRVTVRGRRVRICANCLDERDEVERKIEEGTL